MTNHSLWPGLAVTPYSRELHDKEYQISYQVIRSNKYNSDEIIDEIATCINGKLYDNDDHILFVAPKEFENWKSDDKLLLYGANGCGKSRNTIEIIRTNLSGTRNIYIVNSKSEIGRDSKITSIGEFTRQVADKDIIIWDDFPCDLSGDFTLQHSLQKLRILESTKTKKLIVTIHSSYTPELISDYKLPLPYSTIKSQKIIYDEMAVKNIIISLGRNISRFREAFLNYIEKDIDHISQIIGEAQHTPLEIFLYFEVLLQKVKSNDSVQTSKIIKDFKSSMDYYVTDLANLGAPELTILCLLKLCHQLGLSKNVDTLRILHQRFFGTDFAQEQIQELNSWIHFFRYALQCDINDEAREVIKYDSLTKSKILDYVISNNFLNLIPWNGRSAYLFGIFLGTDIEFIYYIINNAFRLDDFWYYVKKNPFNYGANYFLRGFGHAVGKTFHKIEGFGEKILVMAEENTEFAFNLGIGIGQNFHLIESEDQEEILILALNDHEIIDGLALGLGLNFPLLDISIKNMILELAKKKSGFSVGLAKGFWYSFPSLTDIDKTNIMKLAATKRNNFALGEAIGIHYITLNKNFQHEAWEIAGKNTWFMAGFAYSLCYIYPSLNEDAKNRIWKIVERNRKSPINVNQVSILYYLGSGMASNFPQMQYEEQVMILDLVEEDLAFRQQLAPGLGENYHLISTEAIRKKIIEIAKKNTGFAEDLAPGLGNTFHLIKYEDQIKLLDLTRSGVHSIFGRGLFSHIKDPILKKDIFKKIWEIGNEFRNGNSFVHDIFSVVGKNFSVLKYEDQLDILSEFTNDESYHTGGLAGGIGEKFHLISNEAIRKKIIEIVKKNTQFADSFGSSLCRNFPYMTEDMQEKILDMEIISYDFTSNLADAICRNYLHLNQKIKRKIWKKFEDDKKFAGSMCYYLRDILNVLRTKDQEHIFSTIVKNSSFASDISYGLGTKYGFLKRDLQERILSLLTSDNIDNKFIINFVMGLGSYFSYLQDDLQKKILEIGKKHSDFMSNLVRSIGEKFSLFKEDEQEIIWNKALEDASMAHSISFDIGYNFSNLNKSMQIKALEMAEKDVHFAINLMRGIGYVESGSIEPDLQKRILELTKGTDKITMSLRRGLNSII